MYDQLQSLEGWRDFTARLAAMREDTRQQLYLGTLDKWGQSHDDEKRAVLAFLDAILGFVPSLKEQWQDLKAKADEIEQRAQARGDIHGGELSSGLGASPADLDEF
jgi:uncharacterized protein (DUF3084 family)